MFKTNIKSPGVIFMRLNAAGSEFLHEIFCPQKLCKEDNEQKLDGGMLSAAFCAGSVTGVMKL